MGRQLGSTTAATAAAAMVVPSKVAAAALAIVVAAVLLAAPVCEAQITLADVTFNCVGSGRLGPTSCGSYSGNTLRWFSSVSNGVQTVRVSCLFDVMCWMFSVLL